MLKLTSHKKISDAHRVQALDAWRELEKQKTTLGFQSIIHRADLFEQSMQLAESLGPIKQIVFVGIGGSSLGPKFLSEFSKKRRPIYFLDNVDPTLFQRAQLSWNQDFVDMKASDAACFAQALQNPKHDTAFIIVSKSGNTLETLSMTNLIVNDLQKRHAFDPQKFVVVTETRSNPLYNWAQKHKIAVAEIPVELGGRYSLFSGVGLVLSNLIGLRSQDFWAGAREAQQDSELIESLMGLSLESFDRKELITNFWSYSSSLHMFGLWFQQLWAESLGKPKSIASHFVPVVGTADQHSILQQIAEGETKQWNLFLSVKSVEESSLHIKENGFEGFDFLKDKTLGNVLKAERVATAQALESHGRECVQLELTDFSEFSIGYLMMAAQLWVAGLGFALKINPFDQPGVELGKKLALKLLGRG